MAKPTKHATLICTGYTVPLGDIKILGLLLGILSIILFIRTRGKYTKWLAAVIFVTCFAIVYALNPDILKQLFKLLKLNDCKTVI